MKRAFLILGVLTAILLNYALYQALIVAPTEQATGDVQRIFYHHVPSVWTAFILFFINLVASILYLIWRRPAADIVALVSAEVGLVSARGTDHWANLGASGSKETIDGK